MGNTVDPQLRRGEARRDLHDPEGGGIGSLGAKALKLFMDG